MIKRPVEMMLGKRFSATKIESDMIGASPPTKFEDDIGVVNAWRPTL